jgi:hypothetical protein
MDILKLDILKQAMTARQSSVGEYQINIDNFTRAIAKIDQHHAHDADMLEFREKLETLLRDSVREQKKEQLILDVIREQIEEHNALP